MVIRTDDDARIIMKPTSSKEMVIGGADTYSKAQIDSKLDGKQDTLVSGTNIKTINNQSILGDGNISIQGGGGTITDVKVNDTSVVNDGVANVTVPTKLSQLTNDESFITNGMDATLNDVTVESLTSANGNIVVEGFNFVSNNGDVLCTEFGVTTHQLSKKTDKVTITSKTGTSMEIVTLADIYNCETRLTKSYVSGDTIGLVTNGTFENDYTSGLTFATGDTAPSIEYSGTGIVQWVGTNCKIENGYSIFTPVANKTYDIVFYWNGSHFVGLVNGYSVATSNEEA